MSKQKLEKIIAFSLIISFLIGGISGAVLGNLTGNLAAQRLLSQYKPSNNLRPVVSKEEAATIKVVKEVKPAVVSIVISKDLSKYYSSTGPDIFPFEDFFDFSFPFDFKFYSPENQKKNKGENIQPVGWGTGFIISSDGLILTNKHVVNDEDAEYSVVTNDEKKYKAKVLARDPLNDIALLKIKAKNLTTVKLGDSDKVEIGQSVIAIGNALGEYRNTVTKGVISGVGRTIVAGDTLGRSETLSDVIQTDAAINPGNSGGPLLNLQGEVIGINTAISRQGQLIGFAIPINLAKPVIESVKKYGKIVRPFLGVRYILINKNIAQKNKLKVDYGALIVRGRNPEDLAVIPGSPADKAGLTENDIILEVNGKKVNEKHPLSYLISQYHPGDKVKLKVLSKGKEKTVIVNLGKRED